jgi:hypothetical protein
VTPQAGVSLAELLVAMLLLALSVLAVAPMFVEAVEGTATGADFGASAAFGVDRMERLRAEPYAGLVAGGSLDSDVAGYFAIPAPGHLVRWQIEDNAAALPGTKIVTVRSLALRRLAGPRREVVLTTLRGD